MTDKEIYKARVEGLNHIVKMRHKYSSNSFLELLNIAFEISSKNSPDYKQHRKRKILEKAKVRKRLVQLYIR